MPATDAGSWQHSNLCRCKLLSCLMLAACKLRVNSVWEQNFKASAPIRVLWASFSRQNGRMEKLPQQPPTAVQSNFRDITHTYQTHTHTSQQPGIHIFIQKPKYCSLSALHAAPKSQNHFNFLRLRLRLGHPSLCEDIKYISSLSQSLTMLCLQIWLRRSPLSNKCAWY